MTTGSLFTRLWPIEPIITIGFLLLILATTSLLGLGSSHAADFKVPPKGYLPPNCHATKSNCEAKCAGSENLSACQNCCKRDWYLCLQAKGEAGGPGDALGPKDLAEYQAKCGETFDSKTKKKAIEGIKLIR